MGRRGRGGRGRNHQQRQQQNQQQGQPLRSAAPAQQARGPVNVEKSGDSRPQASAANGSKNSFQSIVQPRKSISRPISNTGVAPQTSGKKYRVVFFDTLNQAKADMDHLRRLASECDQLNIVVRAEASMDDSDLNQVGKLFCGAAWALVHERRRADGWYQESLT